VQSEVAFFDLRSKISTTKFVKTRVSPIALTEKGLYMMTTILRIQQAIEATFAIIETFSKIRELCINIKKLSVIQYKGEQNSVIQKSDELNPKIFEDDLQTNDTETSIELNLGVLMFKDTVKKKK
jgi:hypothetical protein